MVKYKLKLYVAGNVASSQKTIKNLKDVLQKENLLKGNYDLEVIDILKRPQLAEDEKIMATPTLVKSFPEPIRRILGDLSDKEKILIGLDIVELKNSK